MSGPITSAEADWFIDPANGSNANSGTTEGDALESIDAFDEDGPKDLADGDTVALMDTGIDTPTTDPAYSFETNITLGTHEDNTGDYIVDGQNLGQNDGLLYLFAVDNPTVTGSESSKIVFRNVPNHAIKGQASSGNTVNGGTWEWVYAEDYGKDTTTDGGNGFWWAEGFNNGTIRDCRGFNGHEPGDSDGFYMSGPSGNRPGGWLFERCEASYNADDGFDLYRADTDNPSAFVDCDAHHNGRDKEAWDSGNEDGTVGAWGDGNGFKMGGPAGGNNWLYRNRSWKNKGRNQSGDGAKNGSGYDDNGFPGQRYLQNTAWDNEEWGFRVATDETLGLNNLAYENGDGPEDGSMSDENNTWDTAVTVTDSDFVSLDESDPDFLRVAAGSDLVDAGVVIDGYTFDADGFSGSAITFDLDGTGDGSPPHTITETFNDASPDLGGVESTGEESGGGGGTPDPRGIIEDFEHNDLSGEYSGDLAEFAITTSAARSGTYGLETDVDGSEKLIKRDGDDAYPDRTYEWWQWQFAGTEGGFAFFVQSDTTGISDLSGYVAKLDFVDPGDISISRFDNGTETVLDTATLSSRNTQTFNRLEIEIGSGGELTLNYYEGTSTTAFESLTVNDSTYQSGSYGWWKDNNAIDFDDLSESSFEGAVSASVSFGGSGDLTASAVVQSPADLGITTVSLEAAIDPTTTLDAGLPMPKTYQNATVTEDDYEVLDFDVDLTDERAPEDLDGVSITYVVADERGGTTVLDDSDADVTPSVDVQNDQVTIEFANDVTDGLGGETYHHELKITGSGGQKHTAAVGEFRVESSST